MEWWLALLVLVVILRPVVGDGTDMHWLRAHRCHLLGRLSPCVELVPDRVLFVLRYLVVRLASPLDSLVAVLENDGVLLEQVDPMVIKFFAILQILNFVQQFVDN